jgi:hypothetical protein
MNRPTGQLEAENMLAKTTGRRFGADSKFGLFVYILGFSGTFATSLIQHPRFRI